jgi:hypothetical protein
MIRSCCFRRSCTLILLNIYQTAIASCSLKNLLIWATAQRRRTKKRKDVLEQVDKLKLFFSEHWQIPSEQFEGAVITTDPSLAARGTEQGIMAQFVSIETLFSWQVSLRDTLV